MGNSQLVPHCSSGSLQAVPACGGGFGHPLVGFTQPQAGGSIGWQSGYSVAPRQALHEQRVPSSYQHCNIGSAHVAPSGSGALGHAVGLGAVAQEELGSVMVHAPLWQKPRTRHAGRGSSPQLQSAWPNVVPLGGRGLQALPFKGGVAPQDELLAPADPPMPVGGTPPAGLPAAPLTPPCALVPSLRLLSPPQPLRAIKKATDRTSIERKLSNRPGVSMNSRQGRIVPLFDAQFLRPINNRGRVVPNRPIVVAHSLQSGRTRKAPRWGSLCRAVRRHVPALTVTLRPGGVAVAAAFVEAID